MAGRLIELQPGGPARGPLVIRAFRGSKRASVYREQVVAGASFLRIAEAARKLGLGLLSSLAGAPLHELDKDASGRLADEITSLRTSGELGELDDELTRMAELLRWCARTRKTGWARIESGA